MSLADELLDSLTENEPNTRIIEDSNEPHIVIDPNKDIIVPDELKEIAVQREHNVKTVTFDCPRYWDGRDLMKTTIYINYERNDGVKGRYPATNVRVDDEDPAMIHFDWTVSRHVTESFGDITILACGIRVDSDGVEEKHWNSHRYEEMTVAEGLECGDVATEVYPDEITVILAKIQSLENHTHTAKEVGAIPAGGDPETEVSFDIVRSNQILTSEIVITDPENPLNAILLTKEGAEEDEEPRKAVMISDPAGQPVILSNVANPELGTDATNLSWVTKRVADQSQYLRNLIEEKSIKVSSAEVDQFLAVAAVDDEGVPTQWKTAKVENVSDSETSFVDVRACGATGDGVTDDYAALQMAIDFARENGISTIFIPNGTYLLSDAIKFYSNQHIIGEPGAVLLQRDGNTGGAYGNLMRNFYNGSGGYDATENVIIEGLTFDGATQETSSATLLAFCHSRNIEIRGCVFVNGYSDSNTVGNGHDIEVNSSHNVKITNCTFSNNRRIGYFSELVQIDTALSAEVYPWTPDEGERCDDGTVSDTVTVEGCLFEGVHHDTLAQRSVFVGSHSTQKNRNILVRDCRMIYSSYAIRFADIEGLVVRDNIIGDVGVGVYIEKSDTGTLAVGNTFVGEMQTPYPKRVIGYGNMRNGVHIEEPENSGGNSIEVSGAEVGQFLKVKEVDENGVPTAWETAECGGDNAETFTIVADGGEMFIGFTYAELGMKDMFDCKALQLWAHHLGYSSETLTGRQKVSVKSNNGTYFYGAIVTTANSCAALDDTLAVNLFTTGRIDIPTRYTEKNEDSRRTELPIGLMASANVAESAMSTQTFVLNPSQYNSGLYIWINQNATWMAGVTFCVKIWR